jgi:exodeoxyribonuclease III
MSEPWTIATWNVNSLRVRLEHVLEWLKQARPDVLCLQETKVTDDEFPVEAFLRQGYQLRAAGQKTYNGVAIVARRELLDVRVGLESGFASEEQRLISARVDGVTVFCAYVPNGKSVDHPDFFHKLEWLRQLRDTISARANLAADVVVCGDFNVAPDDRDVYDPPALRGRLLFHPDEQRALGHVLSVGLEDAFRLCHPEGGHYSWWDYRAGAFRRNRGMRIDHLFASPSLARGCLRASIVTAERAKVQPSDHAPVVVVFDRARMA